MSFGYNPYEFSVISFVGGSTQTFGFRTYSTELTKPFSLYRCRANFSIIHSVNKMGAPVLTKLMESVLGIEGVDNVLFVEILPEETVNLNGKYIYQITLEDTVDGKVAVPGQGVMYVTNNINKNPF